MITCKQCKLRHKCKDTHKSYRPSEDGDSWAYWCDEFIGRGKQRTVEVGQYVISQGRNYHTMIFDKELDKMVFHSQTSKRLSKRKLKKELDFYFELLEKRK